MISDGCVYRRCGCVDPATGRQYGRACPRLAGGRVLGQQAAKAELPRTRRPRAVVWTPYRIEQWRRTGNGPRWRCGPPSRPRSSWPASKTTGCMPPTT